MKRIVGRSAALIAGLALMAPLAAAADTPADVSLENEINHYLEQTDAPVDKPSTIFMKWKTGTRGTSNDGDFEIRIGGRLMVDWVFIGSEDNAPIDTTDGVFFRRVRFYMQGTVYRNAIYKVQIDFAKEDEFEFKDVYMGLKNVPVVGTLKVGHFKEPFGLENLTSSKYITFMERSMPINAFGPGRNTGLGIGDTALEKLLTWALYLGRSTGDTGAAFSDGGFDFTARVTYLVLKNDDEGMFVHLGAAVSFRNPAGDTARFRARPGTGTGDRIIDTGTIADVDDFVVFGFEAAWVWNSLSVQGEFIMADVSSSTAGDPGFSGFYIMISYFLTGESRPYKNGSFSRVKPNRNFHDGGDGWGAWELAFRIDSLDLNDANVTGGEALTYVFGANWYWNPNMRVMFNVVLADPDEDGVDEVTIFEMRFQADF